MTCIRFMYQNYLDADYLANADVSSEQTPFPADNLYNFERRSKVWRSNGYWVITSSNNGIVFEETSSTPLTATIAAGTYNSDSSFFAAIKAALEDVGDSTYTVTRDTSTYRIKISSNGSGGGGILNLLWTNVSSDAASTLGFSTASDDTGALTYTANGLVLHTEEWIRWDMGMSTGPKAFMAIGKRNQSIQIGQTATIKIQGNSTDVWTSPEYSETLTYDTDVISSINLNGLHTSELRYWRLQLIDTDNPNGYIELGSVYLGDVYTFERGSAQYPFDDELLDDTDIVYSEGGQSFADIKEQSESFGLTWFGLTKTDKEDFESMFKQIGIGKGFFIQMDPNAAFSSSSTKMLRFVKLVSPPRFSLVSPNNFTMSTDFREQL